MEIMNLNGYHTNSTITTAHPFIKCIHLLVQLEIKLYCGETIYVRVPRNKQYSQFLQDIVAVN
jgi:hypothetical protein